MTGTHFSESELKIDPELVTEILTRFIRAEIHRAGFQRAVVGLSGGLDSSTVTFLCARSLGPENVLAVTMPYKTSSEATRRDSQAVVDRLGVRSIDVPITDQIDAYFARFPDAARLRLANKCARERMTVLYNQSASFGAGGRHEQQERAASGLRHAVRRHGLGHQPHRRSLQDAAPGIGRVPWRARRNRRQGPQRRSVGRANRRRRVGFTYAEVDRLMVLLVNRRWRRCELLPPASRRSSSTWWPPGSGGTIISAACR